MKSLSDPQTLPMMRVEFFLETWVFHNHFEIATFIRWL